MKPEQLQAIRERMNKATLGPWKYEREEDNAGIDRYIMDGVGDYVTELKGLVDESDAEFIAHAREDVPALLDEIERLQPHNLVAQVDELLKLGVGMRREIKRLRGVIQSEIERGVIYERGIKIGYQPYAIRLRQALAGESE